MKSKPLPAFVQQFVAQQTTLPVTAFGPDDPKERRSPYGSCWYRATACMLLSNRVAPKADGFPNRTDINRFCKEANFNQHLFDRVARFLIAAEVVKADRQSRYEAGANFSGFWDHDVEKLKTLEQAAVLRLVQEHTGYQPWRPTMVWHAHLTELLMLFFASFAGLALPEDQAGRVLHAFSQLPEEDLKHLAQGLGLKADVVNRYDWGHWLDEKGGKALVAALYEAEWAYYGEYDKQGWFLASPVGLGLLGLEKTPPAPDLPVLFQALPNLCVFAGSGLPVAKLVPLFRFCTVKRIDQVFEFRLDRRRLAETPSRRSAGEELGEVLRELEPLPPTLADLLGTKSKLGGTLRIRWCSALVKPESAAVLEAIRGHPQLKGYLEAGAPPGYLLIKPRSAPDNFVRRCQELGFKVEML